MKLKELLCISGILALFVTECRGENDNSDIIDITDELFNKGKRKASEITGSEKDLTSQQKQKKKAGNEIENPKLNEKEVKKGMNSLDFSLWGKRLDNSRRKKYNLTADIVWKNESLEKDIKNIEKNICYQEELNSNIEDFSSAVPDTTDKKFLCFMAYNSTAINAKYKEYFGLKALLRYKAFNNIKLLEKSKEYYSRAFDDLIEYIKKNRPMHTPKSKVITEWKETFGDIYMRKCLDVDKFMSSEQKVIHELKNKHQQTLANAVQMILLLPEVRQDFSTINEEFIKQTHVADEANIRDMSNQILLALQKLLRMKMKEESNENMYEELYKIFENIYKEKKEELLKLTEVDLYARIYFVLGHFYEKAAVMYKGKHILAGKNIIRNQKYKVCKKVLDLNKGPNEDESSSKYEPAYNKWKVSSNIHPHYHIYYVDNTAECTRMLCMPIHEEDGKKYYLHIIDEMVEHIENLYETEKTDKVHPFKVKKGEKKWMYIEKNDRQQTMETLLGHDLAFYHIKKDVKTGEPNTGEDVEIISLSTEEDIKNIAPTFAEFNPKTPHGENKICIPLLLTPLMQRAVALGPFIKKEDIDHPIIKSVETINREPNAYVYNEKYKGENFSDVHSYYSNMYIQQDDGKKRNIDCYIMECRTEKKDSTVEAVWSVRMPESVSEYTHCIVDEDLKKNAKEFDSFVGVLESREYNKDSDLQGFWLSRDEIVNNGAKGQTGTIWNWHVIANSAEESTLLTHGKMQKEIKKLQEKLKREEKRKEEMENLPEKEKAGNKYIKKMETLKDQISGSKKQICDLTDELNRKPDIRTEFIVFCNVNKSKSNLSAHNELLSILISNYRICKHPSTTT